MLRRVAVFEPDKSHQDRVKSILAKVQELQEHEGRLFGTNNNELVTAARWLTEFDDCYGSAVFYHGGNSVAMAKSMNNMLYHRHPDNYDRFRVWIVLPDKRDTISFVPETFLVGGLEALTW